MVATDTRLHRLDDGCHLVLAFDGPVDPLIARMHGLNGLLDECRRSTLTVTGARGRMRDYIGSHSGGRMLLAGSSVAFDRMWLDACMPGLLDGLDHRLFDVSAMCEAVRAWNPAAWRARPTWPADPSRDDRVLTCLGRSLALAAWVRAVVSR